MANTKRQQADAELLLTKAALRITSDVSPDIPPPHGGDTTRGFLFFGVGSRPYVCEAWSTSTVHGTDDPDAAKRVCSQGSAHLYSTRALALCALRRALEDESAKQLRAIDRLIEQETFLK